MSLNSELRVAARKVRGLWGRSSPRPVLNRAYYEQLHRSPSYRENNWLVADLPLIAPQSGATQSGGALLEIGCGNGRFLDAAAGSFARLIGCDWALSPVMQQVLARHANVAFLAADLTQDDLPGGNDIVVSADVLEHLPPPRLAAVLARIDAAAPRAYHKIACYDDGHSHLSILPPHEWLRLFRRCDERYELQRTETRRGNAAQVVAVIAKGF